MILQKIKKQVESEYQLAYKYFSILSIVNDMELVNRDIQLIAYSISEGKPISELRHEFVKKFGSSMATVGNIISKLYKLSILIKDKRNININPVLLFDFNQDLGLGIEFKHGDKG